MKKKLTKRSLVPFLVAVVWMVVVYTLMFGGFSRVRADEDGGKVCPKPEGNCYWTYCHKNYDGSGNVLSETCNGSSYTGTGGCSEKDCVSSSPYFD